MRNHYTRAFLAAWAVLICGSVAVYALTAPPTVDARRVPWQTTTHYRLTVNWNDGNIANGVKFGALPAKAFINSVQCHVLTAFNAATTNRIDIGTTATGIDVVSGVTGTTSSCVLASLGYQSLTTAVGLGMAVTSAATPTGSSGGWDLFARYVQTGAAATAGQAVIVITYTPDDDL